MVRRIPAVAVALLSAGVVSAGSAEIAAAATAPTSPAVCTSAQIIQITQLAFHPPTVTPGQSSSALLSAANCTNQTQQTSVIWSGRFLGTSTGIPPGCPVIDPIALSMSFAPYAQLTASVGYLVPASCTATDLRVTVQIYKQGALLTQRSADLTIIQPTP